jgi:hypothetical protein
VVKRRCIKALLFLKGSVNVKLRKKLKRKRRKLKRKRRKLKEKEEKLKKYDRKQTEDYIKLLTEKYEKIQKENYEKFWISLYRKARNTTNETRLKKESIKNHPFLKENEKKHFLEELIRIEYDTYDSATSSERKDFFLTYINNKLEKKIFLSEQRKENIKKWVADKNIDKEYKDALLAWYVTKRFF